MTASRPSARAGPEGVGALGSRRRLVPRGRAEVRRHQRRLRVRLRAARGRLPVAGTSRATGCLISARRGRPKTTTSAPSSLPAETSAAEAPPSNSRIAPQPASQPVGAVRQSGGPPTACDPTRQGGWDLPYPEHFLQWVLVGPEHYGHSREFIVLDSHGKEPVPLTAGYNTTGASKWFVDSIDVENGLRRRIVDASPQYWSFPFYADVSRSDSTVAYVSCEFLPGGWGLAASRNGWGRWPESDTEIATVKLYGQSHNRLTDNDGMEYFPVWSPNGDRIAFISHHGFFPPADDRPWITVMDASGASEVRIEDTLLYPPAWSPDGEDIAFLRGMRLGLSHGYERRNVEIDLLVAKSDGSEPPQSIADASSWKIGWRVDSIEFGGPSWSPDGNWIAFGSSSVSGNRVTGDVEIAVVSRDGSTKRIIWSGQSNFPVTQVTWSPDGEEILFIATGVYTVRPDGSGLRRIDPFVDPNYIAPNLFTSDSPLVARAAWSPDSSQIALYDGRDMVVVVNRDGTGVRIYGTPCERCIYS